MTVAGPPRPGKIILRRLMRCRSTPLILAVSPQSEKGVLCGA